MSRTPKQVYVDGVKYNKCIDAEVALNLPRSGLSHALQHGKTIYHGHKIELASNNITKTKNKRHDSRTVKVLCVTTGKRYNRLKDASKAARCNPWTMSVKMETAGQFIDSLGNVYKRLTPMNSKNVYKNTGDTVQKNIPHYKRKTPADSILSSTVLEPTTVAKDSIPDIVKETVNEKIISMLVKSGIYDDIKQLAEFANIKSIEL